MCKLKSYFFIFFVKENLVIVSIIVIYGVEISEIVFCMLVNIC